MVLRHWHRCPGYGGVTIPGSVQNPCGCGTWGQGLVLSLAVLEEQLNLRILKAFPTKMKGISFVLCCAGTVLGSDSGSMSMGSAPLG